MASFRGLQNPVHLDGIAFVCFDFRFWEEVVGKWLLVKDDRRLTLGDYCKDPGTAYTWRSLSGLITGLCDPVLDQCVCY